jgi:Reverse transcriptase (RNA-dependent DNA polymerase)
MATIDKEKADTLNKFFSSVFTRENMGSMPDLEEREVQQLTEIKIMQEEVLKILKSLKTDKSPGPDGIHARMLKECAMELTKPLCTMFRQSLNEGKLPQSWKEGHVTPIFKKGLRMRVDNYRPVSLTSVVCKVMEKIMRRAVIEHMITNNLLSDSQHGFIQGRSCTTQLLQVFDRWSEIID